MDETDSYASLYEEKWKQNQNFDIFSDGFMCIYLFKIHQAIIVIFFLFFFIRKENLKIFLIKSYMQMNMVKTRLLF